MKRWWVALLVAGSALLSACTGGVATDIVVRDAESADIAVTASFTGEAAEVLGDNPELLDEGLLPVFGDYSAHKVRVERSAEVVTVKSSVSYKELSEAGSITGVSRFTLSGQDAAVVARLELGKPEQLLEAIEAAVQTQPDAGAVFETMAEKTVVGVSVTFPGGIVGEPSVTGISSEALVVDGNTVTVSQLLSEAGVGVVTVTGDPDPGVPWLGVGIGGGLVLAVGAVALARRQDRLRPLNA